MLAGELYLAASPELSSEHRRAEQLLSRYREANPECREPILQELFARIGQNPQIVPPFYCDYGNNIFAGDNLYLNYGCVILDCNPVEIGDNLLCGPYVQIYTAHHPLDPTVRLTGRELATPVKIGNNVWIGGGAIICPGVAIADNSVIGAGSVVTKSIRANVVAAGNPCRILREL